MSKLITAKIDVTKIQKQLLFSGQKGTYLDLIIWVNDEPDRFGNDVSIEQKTEKGKDKIYLGNGKIYRPQGLSQQQAKQDPVSEEPADFGNKDDLPF